MIFRREIGDPVVTQASFLELLDIWGEKPWETAFSCSLCEHTVREAGLYSGGSGSRGERGHCCPWCVALLLVVHPSCCLNSDACAVATSSSPASSPARLLAQLTCVVCPRASETQALGEQVAHSARGHSPWARGWSVAGG